MREKEREREIRKRGKGDGCFRFNSTLTVSCRPGQAGYCQAVGCLTCQVNRRQPWPPCLNRRFSCSSTDIQRSAVSARRVLIRDIIPCVARQREGGRVSKQVEEAKNRTERASRGDEAGETTLSWRWLALR